MVKIVSASWVEGFVTRLVGGALHAKQVESFGNAVFGALSSNRLSITAIGRSLARNSERLAKHAVKQIDRLVGNDKIATNDLFLGICRTAVGPRKRIMVSLDWTEYDETDQSRITVNLITKHGRATPLVWLTAVKSKLKHRRTGYEKEVLRLLADCLEEGTKVKVVADRGFGNTGLFDYIKATLGWKFVIRVRRGILVYDEQHPQGRKIEELRLIRGAAPRLLSATLLTQKKYPIGALVAVWDRKMQEPWYLVTDAPAIAQEVVKDYSRRFTCEEQYRDEKDDQFGVGSKETRVSTVPRRNMLTLIHAVATIILTIIGAASERIGYDRQLRANTVKRRTHSLYRQGRECIDGVQHRFVAAFREAIEAVLHDHAHLNEIYGVI